MLSALTGKKGLIVVAVNYSSVAKDISLRVAGRKRFSRKVQYLTTERANENMKPCSLSSVKSIVLTPRSITNVNLAG